MTVSFAGSGSGSGPSAPAPPISSGPITINVGEINARLRAQGREPWRFADFTHDWAHEPVLDDPFMRYGPMGIVLEWSTVDTPLKHAFDYVLLATGAWGLAEGLTNFAISEGIGFSATEITGALGVEATGVADMGLVGAAHAPEIEAADTVLSGHGTMRSGPGPIVPEGTTVTVYADPGQRLSNGYGQLIELGQEPPNSFARTYYPGETLPNLVLPPPSGLEIVGNPTTVNVATPIGDLLAPGMGNVRWAACLEDAGCKFIFTMFGPIPK